MPLVGHESVAVDHHAPFPLLLFTPFPTGLFSLLRYYPYPIPHPHITLPLPHTHSPTVLLVVTTGLFDVAMPRHFVAHYSCRLYVCTLRPTVLIIMIPFSSVRVRWLVGYYPRRFRLYFCFVACLLRLLLILVYYPSHIHCAFALLLHFCCIVLVRCVRGIIYYPPLFFPMYTLHNLLVGYCCWLFSDLDYFIDIPAYYLLVLHIYSWRCPLMYAYFMPAFRAFPYPTFVVTPTTVAAFPHLYLLLPDYSYACTRIYARCAR